MNGLPFNTENARAWHEGRKTQHRELVEPQPLPFPYKVGEKVFIQEPWQRFCDEPYIYEVSYGNRPYLVNWMSPKSMPEEASRSTAIITDIRAERVQDITDEDAKAEGAWLIFQGQTYKHAFEQLWIVAYNEASYDRNDWAWVIELKKGGE